jgi:hypothetical protein
LFRESVIRLKPVAVAVSVTGWPVVTVALVVPFAVRPMLIPAWVMLTTFGVGWVLEV